MKDIETVTFAGGSLDRAGHLRGDTDALTSLHKRDDARAMAVWRGKPAFQGDDTPRLAWLPLDAPVLAEATGAPIFLGLDGDAPRFAYDVSAWQDPAADDVALGSFVDTSGNRHPSFPRDVRFLDLRANMMNLSPDDAGNAAAAKGIMAWHDIHSHCAKCGARSDVSMAGWRRTCPSCGAHHFPRTDPVVIMLIVHGNDVLLGRSPGWPDGMYSLLAGFMEPGETVEDAVRREVHEETDITVGDVGYIASQPWPFPASLMIGCWGIAKTREITRDPVEIEDAIWVSREDVMAAMSGTNPDILPARKGAIARYLLDLWLADKVRLSH